MVSPDGVRRDMDMTRMRIYIDASVLGGYYDDEFAESTKEFIAALLAGKATPLISDTLVGELVDAPEQVQNVLDRVLAGNCERLGLPEQAEELRDAYLAAGVLTAKWADDALHVAHACVARADVIVSWNFKHLVNPLRIRRFNGVNTAQGYGPVVIMTPKDLVSIWEEEENESKE